MTAAGLSAKAQTGIAGFDEVTGGGFPKGRMTLLLGGLGSGRTIPNVQFLTHGAQACKETGIFVAFEEAAKRIVAPFIRRHPVPPARDFP